MNHAHTTQFSRHNRPADVADELQDAYHSFRSDLVRCLRKAGVAADSGTQISRQLGLTRQLSWQLATIVAEPRVVEGLAALPGSRGLALVRKSVSTVKDAPHKGFALSIERLEAAIEAFAGDRARLDLLTAAWGHAGLDDRSEVLRREAFRVQSALYGVNASLQVRGLIFAPSVAGDDKTLTLASYSYFGNLVRYRRDRACRLAYFTIPWKPDGSAAIPVEKMPEHVRGMYAFQPEHSTATNEEVEMVVHGQRGWVTLAAGPLGCSNAVSLAFTGRSNYTPACVATPEHPGPEEVAQFSFVPTERYVADVLTTPEIALKLDLARNLSASCFDAAGGLPMPDSEAENPTFLYHLESRRDMSRATFDVDPSSSTLSDLISLSAANVGLDSEQLIGYRFTTGYALASTLMRIQLLLPSAAH